MGMTSFKGDDVRVAKNYLSETELKRLGLLVSQFLDYAEFQAMDMKPMTMKDWIDALDNMILSHQRQLLMGSVRSVAKKLSKRPNMNMSCTDGSRWRITGVCMMSFGRRLTEKNRDSGSG